MILRIEKVISHLTWRKLIRSLTCFKKNTPKRKGNIKEKMLVLGKKLEGNCKKNKLIDINMIINIIEYSLVKGRVRK